MSRSDNDRIEDVLRASRRLQEIGNAGRETFQRDWPLQDAAVRELEIIGEALYNLSDTFAGEQPNCRSTWRGDFATEPPTDTGQSTSASSGEQSRTTSPRS